MITITWEIRLGEVRYVWMLDLINNVNNHLIFFDFLCILTSVVKHAVLQVWKPLVFRDLNRPFPLPCVCLMTLTNILDQ